MRVLTRTQTTYIPARVALDMVETIDRVAAEEQRSRAHLCGLLLERGLRQMLAEKQAQER